MIDTRVIARPLYFRKRNKNPPMDIGNIKKYKILIVSSICLIYFQIQFFNINSRFGFVVLNHIQSQNLTITVDIHKEKQNKQHKVDKCFAESYFLYKYHIKHDKNKDSDHFNTFQSAKEGKCSKKANKKEIPQTDSPSIFKQRGQ